MSESMDNGAEGAALWIVRRDQGQDVDSQPEFKAWLQASPQNAEAWRRAVAVWDQVDMEAGDDPLIAAMRRDALMARPKPAAFRPWAIAASVASIALVGLLTWRLLTPGVAVEPAGPWVDKAAAATFATADEGPRSFTLTDGSQVVLDRQSAIAVAYQDARRGVRLLHGRAYFAVMHNAARPFRVEAGDRTVADIGTEFDVMLNGGHMSVTLLKGSVAVGSVKPGASKTLKPGQRLDAMAGQDDKIGTGDPAESQAWRTGVLEFRDEPLSEAVAQFNRYGGAPLRVTDPAAARIRISGRFRVGDPGRFARALGEVYGLKVVRRADGGFDLRKR